MQEKGIIAKPYLDNQKLKKDDKGFYLNKTRTNGELYRQRVKNTDLIYSRAEGVTKYNSKIDKGIKAQTIQKSSGQGHNSYRHLSDRESLSTKRIYKE